MGDCGGGGLAAGGGRGAADFGTSLARVDVIFGEDGGDDGGDGGGGGGGGGDGDGGGGGGADGDGGGPVAIGFDASTAAAIPPVAPMSILHNFCPGFTVSPSLTKSSFIIPGPGDGTGTEVYR